MVKTFGIFEEVAFQMIFIKKNNAEVKQKITFRKMLSFTNSFYS